MPLLCFLRTTSPHETPLAVQLHSFPCISGSHLQLHTGSSSSSGFRLYRKIGYELYHEVDSISHEFQVHSSVLDKIYCSSQELKIYT